jgi:hypothetical protein
MQNHKTVAIQRLRSVALDEREAPEERLKAAAKLLVDFGASDRNVPILNKVIRLYERDTKVLIAERAQKLKLKLAKARGLKAEAKVVELPGEPHEPTVTTGESPESEPMTIGTSVSDIPETLSLSWFDVMEASDKSMSRFRWRQLDEGSDLTTEERQNLLKNLLGDLPINVPSVQMLFNTLQKKDNRGFDLTSFPVFRAATEWLRQQGVQIEPPKLTEAEQCFLDEMQPSNIRDFVSKI